MHPSDDELRDALKRRDPPAGFAERVLAKTRQIDDESQPIGWSWMMAAAAMLVVTAGTALYQEQARRSEGERAKREVLQALRITGEKLRTVHAQVQEIQERRLDVPVVN